MQLISMISCPRCGTTTEEQMPTDACVVIYSCPGCGEVLRPEPGDCCVFCSYGSVPCPPVQVQQRAGSTVSGGGNVSHVAVEMSHFWS
jgi:hypothetical protein